MGEVRDLAVIAEADLVKAWVALKRLEEAQETAGAIAQAAHTMGWIDVVGSLAREVTDLIDWVK